MEENKTEVLQEEKEAALQEKENDKKKVKKEKKEKVKKEKKPVDKAKRKKRRRIIILVLVVLFILYIVISNIVAANQPIPVMTTSASKGEIEQTINTSGTVTTDNSKTYFSDVNVQIGKVNVSAGDAVKAGDVLEIQFGTRTVKAEILNVQETVKKEAAQEMYRLL